MKINYKEVCVVTYCPFCGKGHEVEVNDMDYLDWKDGTSAQDAFPYLSTSERELLISGICPTCWNETFGNAEEESYTGDCDDWDIEMGFDPYEGCYSFDC